MPHFMYSDQEYIDEIHGLHPTTLKHETFISVEPVSLWNIVSKG